MTPSYDGKNQAIIIFLISMKKTLFIIDAYNLIYRMFYAIPEMHTRDGKPVNTIFWVAKFLKSLAEDNPHASLVVANDVGQNFREKLYIEYKAQRDHMPDNLKSQISGVFELFEKANIQILFEDGFEADDIIGSIAHQHENNEYQVVIVSSDKDLCQFVKDGHIHIYDAMKRKFMRESDVLEKFWVPKHQVRDYLAIVGDSSDNIPGIRGFGPKKAVDLLGKYNTLDGIYEHLDEISPKMQEILVDQKENAFLSQKLATIVTDLVVEDFRETPFALWLSDPTYLDILRAYEFRSLLPHDEMVVQKITPKIVPQEIVSLEELGELQSSIQDEWRVVISTEWTEKLFLMSQGGLYTIDTRVIDVSNFVSFLIESSIEIVGYDLKRDLKNLLRIKNPQRKNLEGQGSLF
jgi:5'-3' exonuclease